MPTDASVVQSLDALTGGAFSAATAGERSSRIRLWLQTQPPMAEVQQVFSEFSHRDRGAAKLLRERLDEFRRTKAQDLLVQEWAMKAQTLLDLPRLNVADAMAWQRDAAKAGAPLSREPLLSLKTELAERVKAIEDLQHQAQVQREVAVLLSQRIEALSTRAWRDALAASEPLQADVVQWREGSQALAQHALWSSVDAKYPPALSAMGAQLDVVWDAFAAALQQAETAAEDTVAPLPAVPLWAKNIQEERTQAFTAPAGQAPVTVDPIARERAQQKVQEALSVLEQELAQGHGKSSAGAAAHLRQALKESARMRDGPLETAAHAALAAASELQGWQRWRSDQLREELVHKAQALVAQPLDGRRQQEALRSLREQWKLTDQGGVPNHGLWRRFDDACKQAHQVVETWLAQIRAESEAHRLQRQALIEELSAWAATQASSTDWRGMGRELHRFGERWRQAGHVPEKVFADLQPQWRAALQEAQAPLDAARKGSLDRRQTLIAQAQALGAEAVLRVDAIRDLQQRWQAEAQAVPLDRRQEQKLWDAFRKPLDDAFTRKTQERARAADATSAHDRAVLEAVKALEQASADADAARIRAAVAALEDVVHGRTPAPAPTTGATAAVPLPDPTHQTPESVPAEAAPDTPSTAGSQMPSPPTTASNTPRPLVAVRGDDRPGMKTAALTPTPSAGPVRGERRPDRRSDVGGSAALAFAARAPRLGEFAFRAQRDALEHAHALLRRLNAQTQDQVLSQLLAAWEQRDASALPSVQQLGKRLAPAVRTAWAQALGQPPAAVSVTDAMLRLEIAAEVPTPAHDLSARRLLQLQLLTRKNEPAPVQTWPQDIASVLATPFAPEMARRLHEVLKELLKHGV